LILTGDEQPEDDGDREGEKFEAPVFDEDPAQQFLDAIRCRASIWCGDFVFVLKRHWFFWSFLTRRRNDATKTAASLRRCVSNLISAP
jgi:hypothetical protein